MTALARLVSIAALPLGVFAAGCQSQSEGQRCDPLVAGDCQSPLICKPPQGSSIDYGVCCPSPGPSSFASCNPGIAIPHAGSDAAQEGSGEAAAEAAPEAAPEAENRDKTTPDGAGGEPIDPRTPATRRRTG